MDRTLFASLLRSLHTVGVLSFPEGSLPPADFSEKYCYHPALQACFAAQTLQETVLALPEEMIWEVQDLLGIRLLLLHLDGQVWLIGPFVVHTFQEKHIRPILITHKIPASYVTSLQLYYSAFPLISDQDLVHTVHALIRVLEPSAGDYSFRHLTAFETATGQEPLAPRYQTRFDFQSIQKRYELENRFLRMIEEGDVDNVLAAFDNIGIADLNNRRYINAIYSVPEVSLAMVRALSRKAAERGGAPLMEINEITQHAVQTAPSTNSELQLLRNMHTMILELTQAVRRHKLSEGRFSPPIQKAVSFLRVNYSQSVGLEEVAQIAGFVPSYFSRLFKEETGMTMTAYLRKLRCEQAAHLLKETDIPIAEISAYVGYPDNNYFTKAFRKEFGVTPGKWREGIE